MAGKMFPTKNNLISAKKSLALSQSGFELMDKKKTILIKELMRLSEEYNSTRIQFFEAYNEAYQALKNAHIQTGSLSAYAGCVPIDDSIDVSKSSVMGVEVCNLNYSPGEPEIFYGLSSTSSQLDDAFFCFKKAMKISVKLAGLENTILRLAEAVSKTQKRTNALSNIMIPSFTDTIKYISDALDEKEREDFSRLKVIKNQKESENNERP